MPLLPRSARRIEPPLSAPGNCLCSRDKVARASLSDGLEASWTEKPDSPRAALEAAGAGVAARGEASGVALATTEWPRRPFGVIDNGAPFWPPASAACEIGVLSAA